MFCVVLALTALTSSCPEMVFGTNGEMPHTASVDFRPFGPNTQMRPFSGSLDNHGPMGLSGVACNVSC